MIDRDDLILAAMQGLLAAPDCDLDKVADKAIAVADQVLEKMDEVRLIWRNWYGGDCPVSFSERVNVESRSGAIMFGVIAGPLDWSHTGGMTDIVAYSLPIKSREVIVGA